MVVVASMAGQDFLFEFNPSAPEFVPLQGSKSPSLMPSRASPPAALKAALPEARPQPGPVLQPLDSGGGSGSDGGGHEQEEEEPAVRAVSCSPHLLACDSARGAGARPPRRQAAAVAASTMSGRRSCRTAPASPALTATSSVSSSGGRQQGLGRRASNTEEVATLVIKNLSLDFRKEDVDNFLSAQGAGSAEVELHVDPASGAFRGTVFVRYPSPAKAREALQRLGPAPEIGGRKARVEIQKSKNLFGRKSPGGELPQELSVVQQEIERFIRDAEHEVCLSVNFDAHQRKYAHSLAERHNLVHATRQNESGATYVYLSKCRSTQPLGSRKKALSMDIQSSSQLGFQGGESMLDRRSGYEASGSQSCFVGPLSPPGLPLPGLELGTPLLGLCSPELQAAAAAAAADESLFMLPGAALPVPPPGIDLMGAPGLGPPSMWPSALLGSLSVLADAPQPPPGLELDDTTQQLVEGLCNQLMAFSDLEDPCYIDSRLECQASESAMSTEDNHSKSSSSDETDHS
eukprot:gb/GFBE01025585.1/.p1 GENE.gb/GFBE01025585.1/~~gb/GFBE01025585.1/.p1  ORF type:complete len:518 (+),score=70.45 gb/GFBE01025585.1/:1-1554(+)